MQKKTEEINLSDIEKSHLPLGFRKIHLLKIPLQQVEDKLMIYNTKYKFKNLLVFVARKPISKILQLK